MNFFKSLLNRKNIKIRKPYGYLPSDAIQDFTLNVDKIIFEWKNYMIYNSASVKPIDEISELQKDLNLDKKWKAFFLYVGGEFNLDAKKHFPITFQLIQKWRKELNLVFFSNLESGKHLQSHHGNNHGVIRTQIGVDIEEPEKTGIRVEDKVVHLNVKEVFTFDDTFDHEAWNKSSKNRIVLIIDSYKEFPFFYHLINKYFVNKMNKTEYVKSVMKRINERK